MMRMLITTGALAALFGAEAVYQRREERRRQAALVLRAFLLVVKPGLDALAAAMREFGQTAVEMGRTMGRVFASFGEGLVREWVDAQDSDGAELLRLDEVLEEQRRRIVALGRRA